VNKLTSRLDRLSEAIGKFSSWFVGAMVLVTCLVVLLRYGLNMGSVFLQDVVLYLHGALFLLGAAFTLNRDSHVRVDIFYRNFSDRTKALVNVIGNLIFLMPFCITVFIYSWGFVEFSWKIMEKSPEPDGIPLVYLQKTLLLVVCVLLFLQSISETLKNFMRLKDG
jgi:TRAP-type mannitol/chloroaromatic compound transport system permease small subunit